MIICPRCQYQNQDGAPWCQYCGLPFTAYSPQPPQNNYPQPQQQQQQQYYQQPTNELVPPQKAKVDVREKGVFGKTFMGCLGAFIFFVLLIIVIIALSSGGGSDSGNKPKVATTTAQAGQITLPTSDSVNKVGDVITLKDRIITMNSATIAGDVLEVNLTIENTSSENMVPSSIFDFRAKNKEGEKLSENIFDCGPSIGGTLISGDKVKGSICYKISGSSPFRIYYSPSLLSSDTYIWEVQ